MKNAVGKVKRDLPRRVSALLFACLFCFLSVMFPVTAEPVSEVSAPDASCCFGFALFETGAGGLLFGKNYDEPIRPGPTVKLMTGLIACESFGDDPEGEVTIPESALISVSGRSAGLSPGQKIKKKELITLLLSGGFNDAANAVAILVSGGTAGFVDLMNDRAARLGMRSTVYMNATGLDDDLMYTTVRDTVTLAEAAAENELFLECSGKASFTYTLADGEKKSAKNPNILLSDIPTGRGTAQSPLRHTRAPRISASRWAEIRERTRILHSSRIICSGLSKAISCEALWRKRRRSAPFR